MTMTAISRARTGCWTCRARRIKCDETRPVCHRCARNNASCGYGVRLIWHEESLARGVCHGRAGVWSKHNEADRGKERHIARPGVDATDRLSRRPEQMQDRDRTWVCLNTTMTGLEIHFDGKQNAKVETVSRSGSLSPCLSTIPSGGRADCDPALMSYFEHIICSSSTLVDNAHCNPYRYLILPMALKSEGLYHAALAIAANTLKLSDTTYRLPALEHHHRALAHLRGLLTKNDWCESEIYEMLGLVLMLCWFDISDSSRPSWVTHLTGFQNLIRTRKECPGPSYHSQELTSFLNRYFAFHLVLARTAFRVTSTSQAPPILPNTILEASDIIDPYVGFSPALLLMIDQVAELAWTQDGPDEISRKGVYQLKANLDNLPQRLPAEHIDPTTECVAIAEANRLGALFFLYEICSTKSASSKSPILSLA